MRGTHTSSEPGLHVKVPHPSAPVLTRLSVSNNPTYSVLIWRFERFSSIQGRWTSAEKFLTCPTRIRMERIGSAAAALYYQELSKKVAIVIPFGHTRPFHRSSK